MPLAFGRRNSIDVDGRKNITKKTKQKSLLACSAPHCEISFSPLSFVLSQHFIGSKRVCVLFGKHIKSSSKQTVLVVCAGAKQNRAHQPSLSNAPATRRSGVVRGRRERAEACARCATTCTRLSPLRPATMKRRARGLC